MRNPKSSTSARRTSWSNGGSEGDFAITGEPTDLHIGVEAKGVPGDAHRGPRHRGAQLDPVARRQRGAEGRSTCSAPSSRLPFTRESSELFDRPSINLGRIEGGDAPQQGAGPVHDGGRRSLPCPGRTPGEILAQVRAIADIDVTRTFIHPPVTVDRTSPYVRAPPGRGRPLGPPTGKS